MALLIGFVKYFLLKYLNSAIEEGLIARVE